MDSMGRCLCVCLFVLCLGVAFSLINEESCPSSQKGMEAEVILVPMQNVDGSVTITVQLLPSHNRIINKLEEGDVIFINP